MANCKVTEFTGRDVALLIAEGCGDAKPQEQDWITVGNLRNKGYEASSDMIDFTTADSKGSYRDEVGSYKTFAITTDGIVKLSDAESMRGFHLIEETFMSNERGGDRVIWARLMFPDITLTGFMSIGSVSRSAAYDDAITFDISLSKAPSAFGVDYEVNDMENTETPTSITLDNSALTVAVGATQTIAATVLPTGAPQAVLFNSTNKNVATVTPEGEVKGVSVGEATIIVQSRTANVFQTASVEVTA